MLPVTNSRGKFISVLDLESQLEWILADAKHSDGEKRLKFDAIQPLDNLKHQQI